MGNDFIQIENLKAKRGEKIFGFVDVKDNFGTISQLPAGITNGTAEGPTLLITAGVHGCEYDGVEGVTRMFKEMTPEGLKGILIFITCMNLPAFRLQTPYEVPFDRKNLNWSFPGSPTGSTAEIIAHVVMKEFLSKAHFVVDCHGGDLGEIFCPITMCTETDDEEISRKSMELANAFGLDYAFYDDATSKVDSSAGPSLTTFEGSWVTVANKAGVAAICAEAGCDGRYEERDVAVHVRGLKNIMKYLGMIPGSIERESEKDRTTYFRSIVTIKTDYTGIFYPLVKPGENLSLGQPVAAIKDLKGDQIGEVEATAEGVVLTIMTKRFVNNGDSLFYLLKLEKQTRCNDRE
jgi:hypothetical protein